MRKAYLLVYSDLAGSRERIKAWADSEPLVLTWRYDLPHSFYLVSEAEADELAESLRQYVGRRGRFIVTEVSDNRNGWLPKDSWYLLSHKKHKPKET